MTLLTPKMGITEDSDDDLQLPSSLDLPSATTGEDEDASPSPDQQVEIRVPFSMTSPYPMTGDDLDVPDEEMRELLGCNERYLTPSQTHDKPTGAATMTRLLRTELTALFHEFTIKEIRYQKAETIKWRHLQGMSAFDETQPTLPRDYFHRRGDFFNKHIAIYFQRTKNDPEGWFSPAPVSSDMIGRYCYRHWLRMHAGRAPFQRRHFLAKAIEFVVPCEDGEIGKHYSMKHFVTDLPYVLGFHRSLCDSVAAGEEDIIAPSYYRRKRDQTEDRHARPYPNFVPRLREEALSYREHGFRLGHLFRSLVMVVDGCSQSETKHENMKKGWLGTDYSITPPKPPSPSHYEECERLRDWDTSHHRVLLVKTGDDSHLSAPISFLPLFDSGKALPVDREDCDGSGEVAVRVRLDHALEFIEGLIRREEKAVPHIGRAAEALGDEVEELCERWIETVLGEAARVGVDNHGYTWQAIRRAWARLNGEAFEEDQVWPEWEFISRWFQG